MKGLTKGLLVVALIAAGCDSVEPIADGAGDEELITRVELRLVSGDETVVASAVDADGDGVGFEIDELQLRAGLTYTGQILVWDDLNDLDVSEEIEEEADEHQFFYTVQGGAAGVVTVRTLDVDANGLPVGLSFEVAVQAGAAANGSLSVVLSHYDDGPKNGVDRSDETDIDLTFPLRVVQ